MPGTVLPSECEAGAEEVLLETLNVSADGTDVVSLPLSAGSIYRIEVLGFYTWGGCDPGGCPGGGDCMYARYGDAEVQSDDCWDTAFHDEAWSVITLHVDGEDLDWRVFGTDAHHYARVHEGDGASLTFDIHDFCEGCYLDNEGSLEVQIWELPDDPRVWPNAMSCANSDRWLVDNHELVETLRPRVMVLNYDNGQAQADLLAKANDAIDALREGSRYHGWDPTSSASPALDYQVALDVDLRDDPLPPAGTLPPNGDAYPREDPVEELLGLDYGEFFSQEYAEHYGVVDPDDDTRYLTLCEMVEHGMIHDVWFSANPNGETAGGREVVEIKPFYDELRDRIPGPMGYCAGNGCMDPEDFLDLPAECSRSLRLAFIDSTRGPMCFNHSLSHGIEEVGTGESGSYIPYLERYFPNLAGFDLDTRFGTPFDTWYGMCDSATCQGSLQYPNPTFAVWTETDPTTGMVVQSGNIPAYDPICGNVHYSPNAPGDYLWQSPIPVQTSCTHFRMQDGPGGADLTESFDHGVLDALGYVGTFSSECAGPWDVWWRQNLPGYQNRAWDETGYPMLNWWPFLFY